MRLDLESLFIKHDLLLIDGYSLAKISFDNEYDLVLEPILKKLKKRIYLPYGIFEKLLGDPRISKKYFGIQKYIAVSQEYSTINEAIHANKNKNLLVIVGNIITGNQVLKHKKTAVFFSKNGFSLFNKSKAKSQTHRTQIKNLNTDKTKIKGNIPSTNETTYYKDKNKSVAIKLTKELAKGGEGIVYETDSSYLAKIYKIDEHKKDQLKVPKYTQQKLKKFEKVVLDKYCKQHIYLPIKTLYNSENECIGFLMDRARGKPIQYILGGSKERGKHYPNCNYKDLIEMCINFLKLSIKLHEKDIIIGDINPNNVLFDTDNNISLIDCDSFQIDKFPCPVTTEAFLHPAHRGKKMNEFMRNLADEYYAIAVFLFLLTHLGRYPYDCKGSNRDKSQKEMGFPYIVGSNSGKAPDKGQEYWEKLNLALQECFYQTFQKGGKYADENRILKPEIWLKHFEKFHKSL